MQRAIGNGKVVADAGDLAAECVDDGHFGGANFELPPDHGLCLKMKFVQVQCIASIVLPLDATTQVEEFLREFRVRREANNVTEDGAMTGCVFFIRSFTHFARCVPYCCYRLHNLADAQALPCFAAYLIPNYSCLSRCYQ